MRLRFAIPLPGPFYISGRVPSLGKLIALSIALPIVVAFYMLKYAVIATAYLAVGLAHLIAYIARAARRRHRIH